MVQTELFMFAALRHIPAYSQGVSKIFGIDTAKLCAILQLVFNFY